MNKGFEEVNCSRGHWLKKAVDLISRLGDLLFKERNEIGTDLIQTDKFLVTRQWERQKEEGCDQLGKLGYHIPESRVLR